MFSCLVLRKQLSDQHKVGYWLLWFQVKMEERLLFTPSLSYSRTHAWGWMTLSSKRGLFAGIMMPRMWPATSWEPCGSFLSPSYPSAMETWFLTPTVAKESVCSPESWSVHVSLSLSFCHSLSVTLSLHPFAAVLASVKGQQIKERTGICKRILAFV